MPKKLTLEEMQKIAEKHGGTCLSNTYVDSKTKLLWRCAKNHQWEATPNMIKRGTWCPYCSGTMKGTLEDLRRIAEERGGKCLSAIYVNNKTKLLWECAKGHQWQATPDSIKRGTWCLICAGKAKGSIEKMQQIVEERGGKCLSKTYINNSTKLLWECAEGHQWQAVPTSIKSGKWCPYCAGNVKGTLEEIQQIARERGGECLSKTYVSNKRKLLWKCAKGHQWQATPDSVKRGTWCLICAGKARGTLKEMQRIAEEREGKCLSKTYISNKRKLLWECAEGHQWEAKPNMITMGTWCPYCAGKIKGTLEEMQQIAEKRGGKCLSNIYVNSSTRLLWECVEGHQWEAMPSGIKQGQWCPHCAGVARGTLEEMQQIAEERGGKCLSRSYVNSSTKLLWQCAEGHQWEARPSSIKKGSWCPECSSGLGERICRVFFEQLFEKTFVKIWPKWLVNPKTNRRMSLDGYCKSLQLAFEHQGEYHFSIAVPQTNTEEELREVQERDKIKREVCPQKGIILIGVPEIPSRLPVEDVRTFIRDACNRHGIPLPPNFDTKKIDLKKAYATSGAREALKELHVIAKRRRGRCLSEHYIDKKTKLLWQCAKGHQWEAAPDEIKSGYWCPYCAGNVKGTIEGMQQLAKEHGGKCLSQSYINNRTKLLWQCAKGHRWETAPNQIKSGKWCPYCAGNVKRTIEEMQQIAAKKGGKCLSDTYVNSKTALLWECSEKHQWKATPNSIKRGHWCQKCSSKKRGEASRLTIEDMQQIAEERGGRCLSKVYVNTGIKLLWECAEGHQWKATSRGIRSGHWCRKCATNKHAEGRKLGIENMQSVAEERGGKCLSKTYVNNHTKLLWECAEGHQWKATPHSIKSGSWCPQCAKSRRIRK